jgi:hypothetical protein
VPKRIYYPESVPRVSVERLDEMLRGHFSDPIARDAMELLGDLHDLRELVHRYLHAWNDLNVPGDDADELLVRLSEMSLFDPEAK